jgi:phenylalanyl-tRNA synthetase alpha chain
MGEKSQVTEADVVNDMKNTIEKIVRDLFGEKTEMRWIDAYFPFTVPSFEL